jgi:hypothetical protein
MKLTIPSRLPFLEFLGWQIADVYRSTPQEMLSTYERGWQYRHIVDISASELAFIRQLAGEEKSWLSGEFMDFQLTHHRSIFRILENLDDRLLQGCRVYFGGGTLISLDLGEYRISNDIDLICEVGENYRRLRNKFSLCGERVLLKDNSDLEIQRFRADRYGIRMAIVVDGVPIKTEIVAESRFELDPPRRLSWLPVECLSIVDCFTSKLLANADRHADASVYSRDLIDLAFLRLTSAIPAAAIEKAEAAYGVAPSLDKAIGKFQADSEVRYRCYHHLQIAAANLPRLIDGIDLLAADRGLDATIRTISETK